MSTAEKLFEKARVLPEPTQVVLLQLVELLVAATTPSATSAPKAGSAKGVISIEPDSSEPHEDLPS